MLLKGKLAELMVQINPKLYRKHIITSSKGQPMLYVCLSKALYGLLQSVLLFYRKLQSELEEFGFVVNSYDRVMVGSASRFVAFERVFIVRLS